ncbi:hypothetical protein BFL38_13880 [Brachyspira hampsonii]|uniref:Lipoprotein n=1 Tax=Brachyspira hampsonii TaxID=1287055 RepID=A0A1E5NGX2_9SPIR|nr:hypothetical protein [Brachyspira hampsonii]OEJ15376.1 hypothetical protein BFL38_13880 [Brachyspira hampsonii]
MKKLFLFTLLVSSFLVISCSNKDTTGSTAAVIDSKWHGTYSGPATDPIAGQVTLTMVVDANGITLTEVASTGESGSATIPNAQITKVSDDTYTAGNGIFKFVFTADSLTYTDSATPINATLSKTK